MRFKKYLKEMAIHPAPDLHYTEPGALVWIYVPPYLYWYNPKKNAIMRNNKVEVPILHKGKRAKCSGSYNAEEWEGFAKRGMLTHWHLGCYLGIDYHDERYVRGRMGPKGKKMGVWGYEEDSVWGQRGGAADKKTIEKAINKVYKYMKEFIR